MVPGVGMGVKTSMRANALSTTRCGLWLKSMAPIAAKTFGHAELQ